MAIYRQIHTTVWKDDWVGELSTKEKLLWMYLTTNDRTTQCGVYVFSWRYAPFETGLSIEEIRKIISKFQIDGKIKFNESNNEIMIVNWLKYNSARSPKVAAVIDKELKGIKTPEFESEVIMRSKDFDYPIKTEYSNSDTVSIPHQYPIDTVSQKRIRYRNQHQHQNHHHHQHQNHHQQQHQRQNQKAAPLRLIRSRCTKSVLG